MGLSQKDKNSLSVPIAIGIISESQLIYSQPLLDPETSSG